MTSAEPTPEIWTKADLHKHYEQILMAGLSADQLALFRQRGHFGDDVILQSSSGSSGQPPLLLPRGREDVLDIVTRMTQAHREKLGTTPRRLALLGGISHAEGALKLRIANTEARAFELSDVEELIAFEPDFLSCYPSIARVLVARHAHAFAHLQTIKLGGERVLPSDIDTIFAAWPDILIIEQLGSTELPAVALGAYRRGERRRLVLQTDRFSFLLTDTPTWQPLVVRDRFPQRLFPIEPYYDSGDEVRVADGCIVEVRRRDDPANAFAADHDRLLRAGCVNVQIDTQSRVVYYDGVTSVDMTQQLDGDDYRMVAGPLTRLRDSNKLPLLITT
ncbi:MAG: hypothetical protein HOH74_08060 [Gemmatimonadetes bacterium]|jgi:hypothetical protein|nr:hypothetical protein [Gemmatimonadota bacterium]